MVMQMKQHAVQIKEQDWVSVAGIGPQKFGHRKEHFLFSHWILIVAIHVLEEELSVSVGGKTSCKENRFALCSDTGGLGQGSF